MITLPLHDREGRQTGTVEVDEAAVGGHVRLSLLRHAVHVYETRRRVGTRRGRTRGLVAGSSAKLYRQKGTGRARMGTRRTAVRRGGGIAHALAAGPYAPILPRKSRRAALQSALLARLQDGEVTVLDSLELDAPKTKTVAAVLQALGVEKSCLFIVDGHRPVLYMSARNIAGVIVSNVDDLNAYDVLKPGRLVILRAALDRFLARQGKETGHGKMGG